MQTDWAAENLQTIRTLMERSAIYRRALAPIMSSIGIIGVVASVIGFLARIESARGFIVFWIAVSMVALLVAFVLIRRQALKEEEPFWSPPTRRVVQAFLPALYSGFVPAAVILASTYIYKADVRAGIWMLLPIWLLFYGCALHAAGFFMPRGFKLFGWAFIICGSALGLSQYFISYPIRIISAHWIMGAFFGGAHLAYGIYLHFSEKTRNAA